MALTAIVSTLLSVALLTPQGSKGPLLNIGQKGSRVAEIQALLAADGLDPGKATGVADAATLAQAAQFWTFHPGPDLLLALRRQVRSRKVFPGFAQTANQWFSQAGFDSGASFSVRLKRFQNRLGLPSTGAVDGAVAAALAHWWGIHQAYVQHWNYRAQPGDSFTLLALASGQSVSQVEAENPAHGSVLWVGQTIAWTPPKTSPPSSPPNTGGAKPSPSVGVLANLHPLAGLAVVMPSVEQTKALLNSETRFSARPAVAVLGQWALLHPQWIRRLEQAGNPVAMVGYSGILNAALPGAAVKQELSWSHAILDKDAPGAGEFYLKLPGAAGADAVAAGLGIERVSAAVRISSNQAWANQVMTAMSAHGRALIAVSPPPSAAAWNTLFGALAKHQMVLETLQQIWANP